MLILSMVAAGPARAQVSGSIDVESDYRLRAYSLSARQPVATAQIGYDDPSGLYLNFSATGELGRDHPLFLGVQGNIGYARKLGEGLSIDGGVARSQYRAPDITSRPHHYTEFYVGMAADPVSVRIFYSPSYFQPDVSTLYGEVEGTVRAADNWRVTGHIGSLIYLTTPDYYPAGREARYDWRLGVSRQFGRFELHAAVSGGGPDEEYYVDRFRSKTALTAGASVSF